MSAAEALELHPAAALGFISMAALAPVLGKPNARAVRDWCQARGVPYRRDGKVNWVALDDVRRAIAGLPPVGRRGSRADAVAAAVARLSGR